MGKLDFSFGIVCGALGGGGLVMLALAFLQRGASMDISVPDVITRILNSKKAIYAAVPIVVNIIMNATGHDTTSQAMLILDSFFALLVVAQTLLDAIHGSASDQTVPKTRSKESVTITEEKNERAINP